MTTPTAPSQADIVRASSTIQAHRRTADSHWYPWRLLEAAETLSAALQAERTKGDVPPPGPIPPNNPEVISCGRPVDPDPCPPHGIERPARPHYPGAFAAAFAGGAVWASVLWWWFG